MFYLATNQQGDIIGIYNASGNMVVKYEYDAWGNIISTTDANGSALNSLSQKWSDINPFRYRGYYYDAETDLYYLQSRYYDAEVGRFINQDCYISTGTGLLGFNMFAYCDNNPVNFCDPTGEKFEESAGGAGYGGFYAPSYGGGGRSYDNSYSTYVKARKVVGACATVTAAMTTTVALEGLRQEVIYINNTRSRTESKEKEKEASSTTDSTKQYNYWTASIINNKVVPGEGLSYFEALIWAACRQNLLCRDHVSAVKIVAFFPEAKWEPAHQTNNSGYLNHYHIDRIHSNHIWYYG